MQWNSPLGAPRENVLVRQIRVEAWESWNLDLTISFIPALLELAMILFLVGITIFLWLLDDVVAQVVTVIVASFLAVIAAFTLVPVFSRSCPYKSPSAWAVVALCDIINSLLAFCASAVHMYGKFLSARWQDLSDQSQLRHNAVKTRGFYGAFIIPLTDFFVRVRAIFKEGIWPLPTRCRNVAWPERLKTWRDRDLDSIKITKLRLDRSQQCDAHEAAKLELLREVVQLDSKGDFTQSPSDNISLMHDDQPDVLLADISQSAHLIRTLTWVRRASQDARVGTYISECVDALHPTRSVNLSELNTGFFSSFLVADWCIARSLFGGNEDILTPQLALCSTQDGDMVRPGGITGLRRGLGAIADHDFWYEDAKLNFAACKRFWVNEREQSHIFLQVLWADLRHVINRLRATGGLYETAILKRRALELVSLLHQALDSYMEQQHRTAYVSCIDWLGPVLENIMAFSTRQHFSFSIVALGLKAAEVAFTIGRVVVNPEGKIGACVTC